MSILFLGGPIHNQRQHVRWPLPEQVPVIVPTAYFFDPNDNDPIADAPQAVERYELRYASPGGIGYAPGRRPVHPVHVHPDYDGPAIW